MGSKMGSTVECLLHQVLREAVGLENALEVLEFRLSQSDQIWWALLCIHLSTPVMGWWCKWKGM